ncbi:MAG: Hexuronate transporter, partial [bacterium]
GWARTGPELMGYRFLLGLGEAVFFPAAMRGVAEWFQPRDRSKPIGMFLAGASLGAVVATPIVGTMMEMPGIGWRGAFVFTGALGLVLAPFWFWFYRHPADHSMLTAEEAIYLQGAAETAEIRQAATSKRFAASPPVMSQGRTGSRLRWRMSGRLQEDGSQRT